ncbi:serine/threonine-protein kinase Warts-like [Oscarella lobularis]|uniref:serine/threonine-protein kinase Warts-like n=1 Tax=Oscarella lobularis TaxID=121494 RepID=UPI003313A699
MRRVADENVDRTDIDRREGGEGDDAQATATTHRYPHPHQRAPMLQGVREPPTRWTTSGGRESAPIFRTTTSNSAGNSPMIALRQASATPTMRGVAAANSETRYDRMRRELNACVQEIDDERAMMYEMMVSDLVADLERKGICPPTLWPPPEWAIEERQSVGMPQQQQQQHRFSVRSSDSGFPVDTNDDSSRPTSPSNFDVFLSRGGGGEPTISPREGRQMLRNAHRAMNAATNPEEYGPPLDRLSESPRSSESKRSWQQTGQSAQGSPEPNRPIPAVRRSESMRAYFAGESPRETRVRRNESIRSAGVMTPTSELGGGRSGYMSVRSAGGSQTPTAAFEARARRVSRNGSFRTEGNGGAVTPTSQLGRRESLRSTRGGSPPVAVGNGGGGGGANRRIRQMYPPPPPPSYLGGGDALPTAAAAVATTDQSRSTASPNPMRLHLAPGSSTPVAQSPADPPPYFALAFNPVVMHSPMTLPPERNPASAAARRTPQMVPYQDYQSGDGAGGRQTPRQSSRPSSPGNVAGVSRSNSARSAAGSRGPTPNAGLDAATHPPPYHNPKSTPPAYKDPLTTQRTTPIQQQPLAIDYYIRPGPSPGPIVATHHDYAVVAPPPQAEPPPYDPIIDDVNRMPVIAEGDAAAAAAAAPVPSQQKYPGRRTKPRFMERDSPSPSVLEEEEDARPYKGAIVAPEAYKFFMEQHIENVVKRRKEREERRMSLERRMAQMDLSDEMRDQMLNLLYHKESMYLRLKRARMDRSQFTHINVLGRGGFAEVSLVRKNDTGELYAMKTLKKAEVIKRNQVAHVKAERDILAEADNDWVVKLFFSFQDQVNLYFIMDYIPGGDMLSLLVKLGRFTEPMALFYIAELVLAIDSVHKMGFIHRDIKPDNILIDRDGHIKLTDFGLCTGFHWTHDSKYYKPGHQRQDSMEPVPGAWEWLRQTHNVDLSKPLERRAFRQAQRRNEAHSVVGTPNYIAPEILLGDGYTQLCDWWSVGVILYEMVFGQPPFLSPTPRETQLKIINWERTLFFPTDLGVTGDVVDLIRCLCSHQTNRLDVNGIVVHPVFDQTDWGPLRSTEAPYVPHLASATDTSNFDDPATFSDGGGAAVAAAAAVVDASGKMAGVPDLSTAPAFYEFTFRRFYHDGKGSPVKAAPVIYV